MVHHIAAIFLKIPRRTSQYLCEINMSSRTLVFLSTFRSKTRVFSLHLRVPIFSTLLTGLGTVPIRSRAFLLDISQTGLLIFAFHRVILGDVSRFFLRKGSHLSKFVRYCFNQSSTTRFSRGCFFLKMSPTGPLSKVFQS